MSRYVIFFFVANVLNLFSEGGAKKFSENIYLATTYILIKNYKV